MDMDMSSDAGKHACKISMLWNWDTIDTCFISSTWQIRSSGMFAGSCIGVILLVMSLEMLRRVSREYEKRIAKRNILQGTSELTVDDRESSSSSTTPPVKSPRIQASSVSSSRLEHTGITSRTSKLWQQLLRAVIHTVTFAVAYFVMLLAMYYNGYFIICILIGAFLGSFTFSWDLTSESAEGEATYCCG